MSTSVVSIPVPSSGFGPAVDVSSLVGEKTVVLSGRFRGAYVLYGSHDGARFAPLLIFNAGGIESVRQTFNVALSYVRLKSLATGAGGVSASISGLSVPGDNSFTSIGVGGVVDLGTDSYQVDLNFMGFGQVNGRVIVEGSLDGSGFNPIGEFAFQGATNSLLGGGSGIEFSPVVCPDRIRYVRLDVQGAISGAFVVTVGGAVSEGGGGAGTLAATYDAGSSPADQTMTIADTKGGMVVFDASEGGFSGSDVVQVVVPDGVGVAFKMDGGMRLGFDPGSGNILINCSDGSPLVDATLRENVVIGDGAFQTDSTSTGFSVIIGSGAMSGGNGVAVGAGSECDQIENVAVGSYALCLTRNNPLLSDRGNVSVGCVAQQVGGTSVTIGFYALSWGDDMVCIGNSAQVGTSLVDNQGGTAVGTLAQVQAYRGIALGYGANVAGEGGVALGYNAGVQGLGGVAVGTNADVLLGGLAVGYGASAPGESGVAMGVGCASGSGSVNTAIGQASLVLGVGDANLCVGFAAVVGDPLLPSDTRDFHNNIYVGSGYGVYATFSVAVGNNVQMGQTTDSAIMDSCVAIGNGPIIGGTVGGVPVNNGIAVGNGAFIVNIVDVQGNSGTTNNAIAIGTGANSNEEASIAIGNRATVAFIQTEGADATGDIAIGNGVTVDSYYGGVVAIGQGVQALGGNVQYSVVIGAGSSVDSTGCVVVGWGARSLDGEGVAVGAFTSAGSQCVSIGGSSDTSGVSRGIAIGSQAKVTGDFGMAFGRDAAAGAHEVVFGSSDNGVSDVSKFRAVSGLAANADLFTFDQSLVGSPDTTSMMLLIQKHSGGAIVSVPVTLSTIDVYGNSYLQVANT